MSRLLRREPLALAVLALTVILPLQADEGMWLFNAPPRAKLQADHGFKVEDAWLNHLMRSSVRFESGGSGSFVSADGLVITNHHVGLDALQKMSDASRNFVRDGYFAPTPQEEAKCVDLELNVLQSIEDVTIRVNAAVPSWATDVVAAAARRKVFAEIEKESHDRTGLRSDVVTLYQGGQYHLYRYKTYTDIRLVFAPEQQVAFFGGDSDNFEYPRYDLDICLFRVYENHHPIHPGNFLSWSTSGVEEGDFVFVSGHPESTDRHLAVSELEFRRDTLFPLLIELLKRRIVLLTSWSARTDENDRRAKRMLFNLRNAGKLDDGLLAELENPAFFREKTLDEENLKKAVALRLDGSQTLAAYEQIVSANRKTTRIYSRLKYLEGAYGFYADSFTLARTLLRAGDEKAKSNGERLPEFTDPKKESLEFALFSEKPIYTDLEILQLADSLTSLTEALGYSDPLVQQILAGKSPRARSSELIRGTRVRDVAFRRKLYDGGSSAVLAARDPMIEVARLIDSESRALRKESEAQEEMLRRAHAVIDKARFEVGGTHVYPDATDTLRLAYGEVKGYEEDGIKVPAMTRFAGLYQRSSDHHDRPPFDLPDRWEEQKSVVKMDVPLNFVSTCDIIGGNSGSPVVNRNGDFVGLVFDGNIGLLSADLAYDESVSRTVSVHSSGIIEALRDVYAVPSLADELVKGHR